MMLFGVVFAVCYSTEDSEIVQTMVFMILGSYGFRRIIVHPKNTLYIDATDTNCMVVVKCVFAQTI